jgi:hypothetical protein
MFHQMVDACRLEDTAPEAVQDMCSVWTCVHLMLVCKEWKRKVLPVMAALEREPTKETGSACCPLTLQARQTLLARYEDLRKEECPGRNYYFRNQFGHPFSSGNSSKKLAEHGMRRLCHSADMREPNEQKGRPLCPCIRNWGVGSDNALGVLLDGTWVARCKPGRKSWWAFAADGQFR